MRLRALVFVAFFVVAASASCKAGSDESFCAAQKSAYIKRCADGCVTQQVSGSARAACEQQCALTLPLDPQYAARCVPSGAPAAAPSAPAAR